MKRIKNMKLITTLSALSIICATAQASETVRLVVKNKVTTASKLVKPKNIGDCADNSTGSWCLRSNDISKKVIANNGDTETSVLHVSTNGQSAKDIVEAIKQSGAYDTVEVDVAVQAIPMIRVGGNTQVVSQQGLEDKYNDPSASFQNKYFGTNIESPIGSNIEAAMDKATNNRAVDVFVLDNVFYPAYDINYSYGANFAAVNDGVYSDDFSNRASEDSDPDACDSHGASVSSIIGATQNNGLYGVGIVSNANIHPIRVMECGNGYLSDTTAALEYIAGKTFENVTPHTANGGIINISLAGYTDGMGCPTYMQEAIDEATIAGYTIVVAAGNDSRDAADMAPGNCKNVITVAALDVNADKASFSNFGSIIDVSAAGEDIAVSCSDEHSDLCQMFGTSATAPIVSGSLALAYQQAPFTSEEAEMMVKITTHPFADTSTCTTETCGTGILNAEGVMDLALKAQEGLLNTISYALNGHSECDLEWVTTYFGGKERMCNLFSVELLGGYIRSNETLELVSYPKGDIFDEANSTVIGEFEKASFLIENVDAQTLDYKFRICTDGECSETWNDIVTTDALIENKPVLCD